MRLLKFIMEAGEEPGKMELVHTNVEKAYEYAKNLFDQKQMDIDKEVPDFKKNYQFAQKQAGTGRTQRKDMPVIDDKDIKDFQTRLSQGYIDNSKPFSSDTNSNDPFPEGLSNDKAKEWLTNGLQPKDGEWKDDKIKASLGKETVSRLKPIQKQIYTDKSIMATVQNGVSNTKSFLSNHSTFIISSDNYIIDGHHRYLSGLLIDPNLKVNVLRIDAPISKLLPLSIAYGDAVGNRRNM